MSAFLYVITRFVIAGLDPAIHPINLTRHFLRDARVNPRRCGGSPAHDGVDGP
jgi:hypothetical protein